MAIARVSETSNTQGGSDSTQNVAAPPSIVAGNVWVVHLRGAGTNLTVSTLSGWTLISGVTDANHYSYMFVKPLVGGETTETFTLSGSASARVASSAQYSGVDTTTMQDATPTTNSGTNTDPVGLSVTTSTNGAMLILGISINSNLTTDPGSSGMTEVVDVNRNKLYEELQATAGSSGNNTISPSLSTLIWHTVMGALKPAAGDPEITATVAVTAAAATVAAAADAVLEGEVAVTAAAATVEASADAVLEGTVAVSTAAATVAAAVELVVDATLASTTDDATVAAIGELVVDGELAVTLADATVSSTASVGDAPIDATVAVTAANATVSSTAEASFTEITGQVVVTLTNATVTATADVELVGTVDATADDATVLVAAFNEILATVALQLEGATLDARAGPGLQAVVGLFDGILGPSRQGDVESAAATAAIGSERSGNISS